MSVYFARVGEYVKVGYSRHDPWFRARDAVCGNHAKPIDLDRYAPVEILNVIDGDRQIETLLHRMLDDFRVVGEWFLAEPAVLEFIGSEGKGPSLRRAGGPYVRPQLDVPPELLGHIFTGPPP